jgi:hypothetical protein
MLLIAATGFAQQDNTADFYKIIQKHDVSAVLNASPIDDNPVGIIGTDFQRFQIHFSSIKKNPQNPYEYLVSGKTMVKNNRCDFTGTITIKTAVICPSSERPKLIAGQLTAVVRL